MIRAKIMRAHWQQDRGSWPTKVTLPTCKGGGLFRGSGTKIMSGRNGECIGCWKYHDETNGVLPGPPLTANAATEVIKSRLELSTPGWWGSSKSLLCG